MQILRTSPVVLLSLIAVLWVAPTSRAANWPAWRGPTGDGIAPETNAPTQWGRNQNVRWRTPLEGPGNSTPIIWDDTVFLTESLGTNRRLSAFERRQGRPRWTFAVDLDEREPTHRMNPPASSSPVTDGERVIAWFGSAGLVAVDFEGRELWRARLGPQRHTFGYGSSPVLHEDRVFLNFGPGRAEFVVALDKRTGAVLWKTPSPTAAAEDSYGTWSTPLIVRVDDRAQLIVALRDYFAALDPATGRELWHTEGLGLQAKASPVAGEGVVTISGDLRGAELGVRLGGRGNVTDTHRLWRESPPRGRIGTGVIHNGHLYGARANGLLDCVKLETGDVVWEDRQPGAGSNSGVWSSPILVGDRLYIINQGGDTAIVRASPKFEILAVNSLGETCNASPALAHGDLYVRTWQALWCLRAPSPAGGEGAPARSPGPR